MLGPNLMCCAYEKIFVIAQIRWIFQLPTKPKFYWQLSDFLIMFVADSLVIFVYKRKYFFFFY